MDRNIRDLIKRVEALEEWQAAFPSVPQDRAAPLADVPMELHEITQDMSADPSAYRAQHQGRGWWVVLGPDGMKVHTGSMRKAQAEQMVREYSERAAA